MKLHKEVIEGFKPIKLEIIIENKQELEDLLARVNAPSIRINEGNDNFKADGESTQELYDLLYQEWFQRGYYTQM